MAKFLKFYFVQILLYLPIKYLPFIILTSCHFLRTFFFFFFFFQFSSTDTYRLHTYFFLELPFSQHEIFFYHFPNRIFQEFTK